MGFTHLHLHTEYSLLDGACKINEVIDYAVRSGHLSLAITDHGVMYGAIDFYKKAKSAGIKPIIGCEVYVAPRSLDKKDKAFDAERYHLVLLCKNETGYKNLIKMVSESWTRGFYGKPRIDKSLLEKHHEGLIALSACLAGEIPRAILANDIDTAVEKAMWYKTIFGDDFYLEMQNHSLRDELRVISGMRTVSQKTGIPLVVTNDTHYVRKEDAKIQEVLLCIQTNNTVGTPTGMSFETDEFYLKTYEEMCQAFPDDIDAIERTQEIADKCNLEFEFGNTKLPHFEVPDNQDHFEYFKKQCFEGLVKRYGENHPKEYEERLLYELETINKMGYTDYYLIVHDFIAYAKNHDIPVGPGRGSGAGSLAAYCIGITGIDPMKYSLIFERFLNPERVTMPDFDVDFCYVKRGQVIDYVINKYGYDHVAQIVTFGTMAARAAIRDVGRALGMSYATVDRVAKLIPRELNITIDSALDMSPELVEIYNSDAEVKNLIDTAKSVEGMPRHASTHAAGVVITRDAVDSYVPLALNDNAVVTQFTMTTLEELGLLKIDFLGLRYLTVIDNTEKAVRKKHPGFDIEKIDLKDKKTYELFSKGLTDGIFQLESGGMKSVLTQLKPDSIEDIIAVISLYRPGPMKSIPTYIENRHNPEKIRYSTLLLKDILDVTYGCIVYQEQVMQIFRTLAGYSFGRADIVRRAMSKKKHDVMEKERKNFIYGLTNEDGTVECVGAVKNGVNEKTANEIFDTMSDFSQYAFNKSHAAAYAFVAYRTAYLKAHYPNEYFAALISSVLEDTKKVAAYIAECTRHGIRIVPPDVNVGFDDFTVQDNDILFGMLAIKNLGRNAIKAIIREREDGGKFESFSSFCYRMYGKDLNKRAIEALIYSGALDSLDLNRRQMITILPEVMAQAETSGRIISGGQMGLFGNEDEMFDIKAPDLPEFEISEKLAFEKEFTGIYISGHPLAHYDAVKNALKADNIVDIINETSDEEDMSMSRYRDNSRVSILAIVTSVKKKVTKNNDTMAFITVEDTQASIEVIVFAKNYLDYANLISVGNVLLISGRLSIREDEECKIVCESISAAPEKVAISAPKKKENKGIYFRVKNNNCAEYQKIQHVLDVFDGNMPVYYYFTDENKLVRHHSRMCDVNDSMLRELKRIIGEENIGIK
ncbi:MAG: DNA polymerase III subunit alpha [Ruminococcaceae bacterium]|nr:DNA polymerase III subunit alpha [Oscillospiraceae bacterium]